MGNNGTNERSININYMESELLDIVGLWRAKQVEHKQGTPIFKSDVADFQSHILSYGDDPRSMIMLRYDAHFA